MLELERVTYQYQKEKTVLDCVSLRVRRGEFVAVVGRSGAGKTTLLRLCNGSLFPQQGTVRIAGKILSQSPGGALRSLQQQVAMIYQDFCLVPELTVLQNVLNGALYRISFWRVMTGCFPDVEMENARDALTRVGLLDKAEVPAALVSGGEKQRTAIARALMQQAKIILADEPAASLDPATADQVLTLLKQLQTEHGLTVVMNSHNIQQAKKYADRLMGLKEGRIVKDLPAAAWQEKDFADVYGGAAAADGGTDG